MKVSIYRVRPRLAFARVITSARAKMEPPQLAPPLASIRDISFRVITSRHYDDRIATCRRETARARCDGRGTITARACSASGARARPFARA